MRTLTFTLTIEGIVDDAHLNELIDAVNEVAYVSNVRREDA